MGVQLRTGGTAIAVAAAAATAVLGPILADDAVAPPSTTAPGLVAPDTTAAVATPDTAATLPDDGAPTSTLLPGATMHNDLDWTMQIGAEWQSQEGDGPVQWATPDGTVAVVSEDSTASIDSYADGFAFSAAINELNELSETSVSPQTLDDGTDARVLRASGTLDGEPVLVFGWGIARPGGFVTAVFTAPAADYGVALSLIEPYLRTLRPL
jgi:hypothetical protein